MSTLLASPPTQRVNLCRLVTRQICLHGASGNIEIIRLMVCLCARTYPGTWHL